MNLTVFPITNTHRICWCAALDVNGVFSGKAMWECPYAIAKKAFSDLAFGNTSILACFSIHVHQLVLVCVACDPL